MELQALDQEVITKATKKQLIQRLTDDHAMASLMLSNLRAAEAELAAEKVRYADLRAEFAAEKVRYEELRKRCNDSTVTYASLINGVIGTYCYVINQTVTLSLIFCRAVIAV